MIRYFARKCFLVALLGAASIANAENLRISLPLLSPLIETKEVGPLTQLANVIAREWEDGTATILEPVPFDQSVSNVVTGKADIHLPLIAAPGRYDDDLPYRYSTTTLYEVPFALYSRADNDRIDLKRLTIAALSKLRLETDRAHTRLFYFGLRGTDSVEGALRRVAAGQIDGFLFASHATDPVIRQLKLDNLVRTPYRRFKVKFVLPKGPRGDELDEKLDLIIGKLKDSGEYQRIMARVVSAAEGR